jgi:hypothetical protein
MSILSKRPSGERRTFVGSPHQRRAPIFVRLVERELALGEEGTNLGQVTRARKVPDVLFALFFVPAQ